MSELLNRIWTTLDGRQLRVRDMARHHVWNAMRMIERKGYAGSFMHQAFKEKLGHVSKQEELKFKSLNETFERTRSARKRR